MSQYTLWLRRNGLTMELDTNFRYLKRSTKKQQPGDVFAMLLPDKKYLFGRVIFADLPRGHAPMPGANLLYIYNVRADSKEPPISQLTLDRLLIPPFYTNNLGWARGAFETVAHVQIGQDDLLAQHCFWSGMKKRYFDETGTQIPHRLEPCGTWGLGSYRKFDDLISDALGIERAPIKPGQ